MPAPCILVVEDEPLLGLDLRYTLRERGFRVAGPYGDVESALSFIRRDDASAGVLDFNLGKEDSTLVADALAREGIPFVWVTGMARSALPLRHRNRTIINKPYDIRALVFALQQLLEREPTSKDRTESA